MGTVELRRMFWLSIFGLRPLPWQTRKVRAKVRVTIQGLLRPRTKNGISSNFQYKTKFHDDKRRFTNSVPKISR